MNRPEKCKDPIILNHKQRKYSTGYLLVPTLGIQRDFFRIRILLFKPIRIRILSAPDPIPNAFEPWKLNPIKKFLIFFIIGAVLLALDFRRTFDRIKIDILAW